MLSFGRQSSRTTVSTRTYAEVIALMAETVGISKCAVASAVGGGQAAMTRLARARFDELDILAVCIEGIRVAGEMILVVLGLNAPATPRAQRRFREIHGHHDL